MRFKTRFKRMALSGLVLNSVVVASSGIWSQPAQAALKTARYGSPETSRPFGLGVVVGEPMGVTAKYWLDRRTAIDSNFAFSFYNYFLLYADFLYHFPGALGRSSTFASQLNPYIGVGLEYFIQTQDTGNQDRTYFRSDQGSNGLGVRIPLGVEWRPGSPPLGVFVELTPGIGVIPATFGFVQGGVGIRFYF